MLLSIKKDLRAPARADEKKQTLKNKGKSSNQK
jgi:hypothetical protein